MAFQVVTKAVTSRYASRYKLQSESAGDRGWGRGLCREGLRIAGLWWCLFVFS